MRLQHVLSAFVVIFYICTTTWAVPYYWTTTLPDVPAYGQTEQAVFWASSNNSPEQSVLLHGAFTASAKTIRLAPLAGAASASAAVSGSSITVPATSMGYTGLNFMLPKTFPRGPFAYRVEDAGGLALVGSGNLPTIHFCEGLPASFPQATAPLHEIRSNAVEIGGVLRVVGKDFPPVSKVQIVIGGVTKTYTVNTQNPYMLSFTIPSNQGTGTGTISVGASSTLDATFGPTMPITVIAATTMTSSSVTPSGLVADGTTDNAGVIQSCLDSNLPTTGTAKYISFPAGNYRIASTLTLHPHQYLVGSASGVVLIGSAATAPATWITGSSYWGLVNLTVQATINTASHSSVICSDSTHAGHVVLNGVTITANTGLDNVQDVYLWGPDIQMVNCTLNGPNQTGNMGQLFALNYADGAYINGTNINRGSLQWNYINVCQNVIFEGNNITGLTTGTADSSGGMSFTQGANGTINENIYFGGNSISNCLGNDCEAVTIDGGGCDYEGLLSSSSASSMVLANAPDFNAGGGFTRVATQCIIGILAGKGQGQYRVISSYNSATQTVGIAQPWDVVPDTASVVVIIGRERHLIFYGNSVTNAGELQLYGGAEDCEICNNTFEGTQGVLLNSLLYSGAYQIIVNTNIQNNYLHGTFYKPKTATTYPCNITMEAFTTGIIGGTMVRNNVGPAASGTGFLAFTQGGLSKRLVAFLEEGESAPTDNTSLRTVEANSKFIQCKENALATTQPQALGGLPTTVSGTFGCKFTTGTRPITVTSLGRWVVTGVNSHMVGIYSSTGSLLASVTVPSGGTKGTFQYATLSAPIVLSPNTSYLLESTETAGQEKFYDSTTIVRPGNGIVIDGPVVNHVATATSNASYGPVSMIFTPEMPLALNVSTLGSAVNSSTLKYGVNFTVGSTPMTVNRIGRWVLSGNSTTHQLQIFNAATNVQVTGASVTVATSGAPIGEFVWGTLATPVTLSANTTYYVESSEVSGSDTYSDVNGTILNPGAGAKLNAGEASTHTAGTVNNSYVPVNMLVTY